MSHMSVTVSSLARLTGSHLKEHLGKSPALTGDINKIVTAGYWETQYKVIITTR